MEFVSVDAADDERAPFRFEVADLEAMIGRPCTERPT